MSMLLLENDANIFSYYQDEKGQVSFRIKSYVDSFTYRFKQAESETRNETMITFSVREKRAVSFHPSLAKKQKAEIMKIVEKASNFTTYKKLVRGELGDAVKYIKVTNKDNNEKK